MPKIHRTREANLDKSPTCQDCGLETTDMYRMPRQPARCVRCHETNYIHRRPMLGSRSGRTYHPDHYAAPEGSQDDGVPALGVASGQEQHDSENQEHVTPPADET